MPLVRCRCRGVVAAVEGAEAGMAEADIAALLIGEGAKRRCQVPIALIAADRRITKFRHPLPTTAPLLPDKMREVLVRGYVMIILSLLREGLVASVTRFKRVGELPDRIPSAYARICGVEKLNSAMRVALPWRSISTCLVTGFRFAPRVARQVLGKQRS